MVAALVTLFSTAFQIIVGAFPHRRKLEEITAGG